MSYEFGLCFKQVENESEAFAFARKVTSIAYENAKEIIKCKMWSRPSQHYNNANIETDFYWLYSLFDFRFVYWKNEGIVGLFDTGYPDVIKNCFDCSQIFQNATDQNYDLSSWSNKIELFKRVKTSCENLSDEEFAKEWDVFGFKIDEYDCENLPPDYCLCTLVYKKIYQELHLDIWEDDGECDAFYKFTMSAITSGQKFSKLKTLLRIAIKKEKEEDTEL